MFSSLMREAIRRTQRGTQTQSAAITVSERPTSAKQTQSKGHSDAVSCNHRLREADEREAEADDNDREEDEE